MAKAFRHFAREHPRIIFELYTTYKPKAIYERLKHNVLRLPIWQKEAAIFFAALGAVVGFATALSGYALRGALVYSVGALLALLLVSNLPHLFAYPIYMLETTMLLFSGIFFALFAAAATMAGAIGYVIRKASRRINVPATDTIRSSA